MFSPPGSLRLAPVHSVGRSESSCSTSPRRRLKFTGTPAARAGAPEPAMVGARESTFTSTSSSMATIVTKPDPVSGRSSRKSSWLGRDIAT